MSTTTNPKPSRKGIGGPKTPEGKRRSSQNARKHGLRAAEPAMEQLMAASIAETADGFARRYRPSNVIEEAIVRQMAHYHAHMWHARKLEAQALNHHMVTKGQSSARAHDIGLAFKAISDSCGLFDECLRVESKAFDNYVEAASLLSYLQTR